MKRIFTKSVFKIVLFWLLAALSVPAFAQTYTVNTVTAGARATALAMALDGSGDTYVIEDPTYTTTGGEIVKYAGATGARTVIYSGVSIADNDDVNQNDDYAFGIAVASNKTIYFSTSNNSSNPGNVYQMTYNTGTQTWGTPAIFISGTTSVGYFQNMCMDASDNLYVLQYDVNADGGLGTYEVAKYNSAGTAYTDLYDKLETNFSTPGTFSAITGLACDPSGKYIYVADWFIVNNSSYGGFVEKLTATASSPPYNSYNASQVSSGNYTTALACDASGNLYATNSSYTNLTKSYSVVEYPLTGGTSTLYTGLSGDGVLNFLPFGMAVQNSSSIIVLNGYDGTNEGDYEQLVGSPTASASGVSFSSTGPTGTTITWTNGSGASRAVFMELGSSGNPAPANGSDYTANTVFGSGGTQIGSTGWYCVYNGTGSSVTVTGLSPSSTYRVAVVEYNGSSTYTNYNAGNATNNPNNVTTATPTIATSGSPSALSTTSGTASSSTSFGVSGTNLVANVTATAPTGFDVSLNNSTWSGSGGSVTLTESSGTLSSTPVYVRLDAGDAVNPYSGNVALTSTSATTVNVAVSGTVTSPSTTLTSLTAVTSTVTNASSVQYTATFAASVSGLSTSDFTVIPGGSVSGQGVSSVTGSGTTWTITVNTGSGDGTVQLEMNSASGVSPSVTDLPFNGTTYTIDKTAPTVTISAPSPSYGNSSASITYTVTVTDINLNTGSLSNMTPLDVYLNSHVTGTATINALTVNPSWTQSGDSYSTTVTFEDMTGDGSLSFTIPAGTFTDNAGNSSAVANSSNATIDNTAPVVAIGPPSTTLTNTGPVTFDVSYSDANFNSSTLSAGNITVNSTGGAAASSVTVTPNSSTDFTVTLSGITGNGSLGISVAPGTSTDLAGNTDAGAGPSTTFTVDNTAPTVSSITATTPSNTNPTNATSVSYTATFSEAVTGVSASAFTATTSGSVATTGIVVTPVSSSVYTVTVSGISGTGTLRLDLNSSGTGITDLAGNAISGGFTGGDVYNIDNTPPSLTSLLYSSSNANAAYAKVGDVITLTFGTTEAIQTPSVTIAGHTITATNTGGNNYSASYMMTSGDTEGRIPFNLVVTDIAGNQATFTDVSTGNDITFDMTPPTVAIGQPSVASVSNNGATSVTYTITYADANFNTSNLTTGGITLNATGTATGTVGVTGAGTSYTVTISGISGVGTLGISVGAGAASDLAGNTDAGAGPSTTFNVLNDNALLSSLVPSVGNLVPAFAPGTTSYAFHENNNTTSITLTPTAADPNATITVNGTPVASGTASGAINLNVGSNPITVVVTAQDGTTTQTYNLTVNRTLEANANLTALSVSSGSLSPSFSTATTSYSVTVPLSVTTFNVTPTVADPNATVTVNGSPVTSGSASSAISLNPGANVITVVVTAANGVTKNTYTVTVTPTPSNNSNLSALAVSSGLLTGAFHSAITEYNVTVNNNVTSINITPTTADPNATVSVNGSPVTSGTASGAINLSVGSNSILVVVTAQNGSTTTTYTVNVTRVQSGNANLLSLTTSSGVLSPTFSNATTGYSVSVPLAVSSITVTPTTSDPGATVTVNGSPVTSGTASSSVSLSPGPNTINVVVTAANGTTTNTFTLTVTQTEAASAMLSALATNPGALIPGFKTTTTSYSVTVNNVTSAITLTPTAVDPSDAITVNGITTASGSASAPVSLNVGSNAIPVVVTSPDGSTSLTYTVNVTRLLPSNANLLSLTTSSGTLSPAFDNNNSSYNVGVPISVNSVSVTPTTADPNATVTVDGSPTTSGTAFPVDVSSGSATVTVVVTAANGITTKTFTLNVTQAESASAMLSALSVSPGALTPTFKPGTTSYNVTVNNNVSSVSITPTTVDPKDVVTVNGAAATSGSASGVAVNVGSNSIPVVVTAPDGSTNLTYTVNVTRVTSSNDNLLSLKLSSGTLSPVFANSTTSYTASVDNSVASITVTPTTSDPNATVTVNSNTVTSGMASGSIALSVGSNPITVVVTAANGVNTQTYTVTVTRAAGGADIYNPISVTQPNILPVLADDGIVVHQGVSPNGDGIEDYLQIDNISQYPDNHLAIMNRNGQLVYDIKGYDNSNHVFDGHSNKNGQMQLPGTYFFSLDYTVNGTIKHKTGFLVLKY